MSVFCANCGHENEDLNKFCGKCGALLPAADATVPSTPVSEDTTAAVTGPSVPAETENPAPFVPNPVYIPPVYQVPQPELKRKPKKKAAKLPLIIALIAVVIIGGVTAAFFGVSAKNTKKYEELIDTGNKYLDELKYEEAVETFLEAIDIKPKREEAYVGAAEGYIGLEEPEKAKDILKKGLEKVKNPSDKFTDLCDELGVDYEGKAKDTGSGEGSTATNTTQKTTEEVEETIDFPQSVTNDSTIQVSSYQQTMWTSESLIDDYKIGIITGTAAQFPEEYNTAVRLKDKFEGKVFIAQYPDPSKLKVGTPEIVNIALNLADTKKPDAMIFAQAVVNTSDAVAAVKKKYPKMIIVCVSPEEEIKTMAQKADLVFTVDEAAYGKQIVEKAKDLGAAAFINYSFRRHNDNSLFAARNKAMEETCKSLNLKYVYVNSIDPRSYLGIEAVERFIAEDVQRKVNEYGKKTAFFSSDYFAQEQIIKSVIEFGTVMVGTTNPSPFTGFPGALDVKVTQGWEDGETFLESLKSKALGMKTDAKLATWSMPSGSLMLRAAAEYLQSYFAGKTQGLLDKNTMISTIQQIAGGENACTVGNYKADKVTVLKNCFTVLCESIDVKP